MSGFPSPVVTPACSAELENKLIAPALRAVDKARDSEATSKGCLF